MILFCDKFNGIENRNINTFCLKNKKNLEETGFEIGCLKNKKQQCKTNKIQPVEIEKMVEKLLEKRIKIKVSFYSLFIFLEKIN